MVRYEDQTVLIKSYHLTKEDAMKSGKKIKLKNPNEEVYVYDNVEKVEHIIF